MCTHMHLMKCSQCFDLCTGYLLHMWWGSQWKCTSADTPPLNSGQLWDYLSVLVGTLSLHRTHARRGVCQPPSTQLLANGRRADITGILFGRALWHSRDTTHEHRTSVPLISDHSCIYTSYTAPSCDDDDNDNDDGEDGEGGDNEGGKHLKTEEFSLLSGCFETRSQLPAIKLSRLQDTTTLS